MEISSIGKKKITLACWLCRSSTECKTSCFSSLVSVNFWGFCIWKVLGFCSFEHCYILLCQEPESKTALTWNKPFCFSLCMLLPGSKVLCEKNMFADISFAVSETFVAHCWGLQSWHCSCIQVHKEMESPQSLLHQRHIQPSCTRRNTLVKCQLLSNQKRWLALGEHLWCYRKQRSLRPDGQKQNLLVLWKTSLKKCLKNISDDSCLSVSRSELAVVAHGEKTDLSLKRCTLYCK